MYNICSGVIRWLISTSIKMVLEHFCAFSGGFHLFRDMNTLNFDLQKVGQGLGIQLLF